MFAKLVGIGALYGIGFTFIKSFFPFPVLILITTEGPHPEGDLIQLAIAYMASGLIAGLIAGPLFGILMLLRKGEDSAYSRSSGMRLVLSLGLGLLTGLISGILILAAYFTGILAPGDVLDPLKLIRDSNFPLGTPLLVAWTLARDLLPASMAGLFLAPVTGGLLLRLYSAPHLPGKQLNEDKV